MFNKKFLNYFFVVILLFSYNYSTAISSKAQNATAYEGVRNFTGSNCNADVELEQDDNGNIKNATPCYTSGYDENTQKCQVGSMEFNPFNNRDMEWNYGNDACIAYIVGTGVALQLAFFGCRLLCPEPTTTATGATNIKSLFENLHQASKSQLQRQVSNVSKASGGASSGAVATQAMGTVIDPFMIIELGIFSYRCGTLVVNGPQCCAALASCSTAYGIAIAVLGGIFETAKDVFNNIRICGDGYRPFIKRTDDNSNIYTKTKGPYANYLEKCFKGEALDLSNNVDRSRCDYNKSLNQLCDLKAPDPQSPNSCNEKNKEKKPSNIHYRQYLFQGIEYEDRGEKGCDNPDWSDLEERLGYKNGKQRYYYRGSGETPNYACNRFLSKGLENESGFKAYECCKRRSQETICLERFDSGHKNNYVFCSKNSRDCSVFFDQSQVVPVKYKIFEAETDSKYLCARTYSVCPYDHNLAGGTEIGEVYTKRPSIVTNFCQHMRHCIKKPPISNYSENSTSGFFFAEACFDLIGDSQFMNGVDTLKFSPIKSRNFTAPIVQCIKESLENNFFGTAGRTTCKETDSYVNPAGKCISKISKQETDILYTKGQLIKESVFKKLQNQLKFVIKIALVFAVLFFGFQVLMAAPEMYISKKTITTFIIKLALVSFFAIGNGWQGFFLDSVLKVSTELSNITFQPKPIDDGCNFPKFNHNQLIDEKIGKTGVDYSKSPKLYPPSKDYLRIWDTMDCKISRAIGYGPEVSTSNLAKMVFAGFLSGPLGITFFFAAFAYAFMLISIAIRAIHITIASLLGVILLIYISPITITCVLFERTKGIFENWWKQLLGFILQPMILFAYLGLLFTIFDHVFIGDAKFVPTTSSYELPTLSCENWLDSTSNTIKEPNKNSIYCIFNFPKFKNYTGLELFDLALPILTNLDRDKINVIFKAAILMFIFFNFLDKITFVARKLVGGAELKPDDAPELKNKLKKFAKGVQSRALNATTKYASKGVGKAREAIRSRSDKPPIDANKKSENNSQKGDGVGGDSSKSDAVGGDD